MQEGIRRLAVLLLATSVIHAASITSWAQQPDFSGNWKLDAEASDDTESKILEGAGEDTTTGMTRLRRVRLIDRLVRLARALDEIEIEQTARDLIVFDRRDNTRIYYLDGEERLRQMPWGASLDVVAQWDGPRVAVRTKGDEIGEIYETFGMEGRQLVYLVRIENENFAYAILIRNYYDRQR